MQEKAVFLPYTETLPEKNITETLNGTKSYITKTETN